MILTLGCFVYLAFFLLSKGQGDPMGEDSGFVAAKDQNTVPTPLSFDLKPNDNAQARDIFSLSTDAGLSGAVEITPKGQLPAYLKVVGILIGHPSQIIIEDSNAQRTYFIGEKTPQGGIKIVQAGRDQIIINYQGQDISVPVNKI